MLTVHDLQFSTYVTKLGPYDVEVWDDGDIIIDVPGDVSNLLVRAVEMASFVGVVSEFIEERKRVKAQ